MKKLVLIFFLFSLFSGCELFERCDDYCSGNVLHECTNNGGGFGGSIDRYTHDCSDDGLVCVEFGEFNSPKCVKKSVRCDENTDSYCVEEKIFSCYENDEKYYENSWRECYDKECVEISNDTMCLTPVEECNDNAEKVCVENKKAKCYKIDDDYYLDIFNSECEGYTECVNLNNDAVCLKPVNYCKPSSDLVCIGNSKGYCWEVDGSFYADIKDVCSGQSCVDFGDGQLKCLEEIDECDPDTESFCYEDMLSICYENNGEYYYEMVDLCANSFIDGCVYDPETKSAHCLSDED